MARNLSTVFKLQGTIGDVTGVNSKRYGYHLRARKNSKTAFVMTQPLAESKDRLQLCNQYAMPVYHALRPEPRDGDAWSRLVKLLFAELKAGRPLGLECLKGFECNLQHPLSEVLAEGYDFSATAAQNQLHLNVLLHQHPKVEDKMPRTGYQLRFVAIFPDAVNGTVRKEVALGPLTKYNAALEPVELTVPLPAAEAPCMLLMGIVPHLQGEGAARIMSDSGMKVVWAADRSVREVAEVETGVEIKADVPVAGTGVAAGNAGVPRAGGVACSSCDQPVVRVARDIIDGKKHVQETAVKEGGVLHSGLAETQNNAYLLPGETNGNENVTITQSTFHYNVTENKIPFAAGAYGAAWHLCFGPDKDGNSCQPPGYQTWSCSYPASCVNYT